MRTVVAGAMAVALASPAGGAPARRDRDGAALGYAGLVEMYERGDDGQAIREIVTWAPVTVIDVIHGVEKGRRERAFARVRQALPAAVMLHTESGLSLNWLGDSAAAATQWRHAEMLAALEPATPEQAAFLRAWHQALGQYFLGSYAVEEAVDLLGRGLRRFPDDVPIALALGQAYEARGTFARGRTLSLQVRPSLDSLRDLRAAEDLLQGLVARDPALAEARLHLGRVLDLTGRSDAALAEFREVAAGGAPRQRYLAHLFAGELLRRRSLLAEAREEFTQATGAWPGGQAAAIGMSETLHRLGERAAAASTLTEAIEDKGGPPPADPFRTYHFGDRAEQKQLLETVKATVRRRAIGPLSRFDRPGQ